MKLTGKAKAEFLARMARGRKKAARNSAPGKKANPPKYTYKVDMSDLTATIYRDGSEVERLSPPASGSGSPAALARKRIGQLEEIARRGKWNPKKKAKKAAPKKAGPSTGKKNPRPKRSRLNPAQMDAAIEMYERFHGRPPNRTIEYDQDHEYRSELAELGDLKELRFDFDESNPAVPLLNFGKCQVTCTADGENIYFIGGNQSLDLEALGIPEGKDYIELGPCGYIEYHTKKGFHDFAPIDYQHEFGEENDVLPVLCYDALNRAFFLVGGDYKVKPEGITN